MADNSGGGSTTILAFIVGALLIAVVGLFVFRGGIPGKPAAPSGPSITITAPKN